MQLNLILNKYCEDREKEFDLIGAERKEKLKLLSQYISKKYQKREVPKAIVICTHNSRRSHLGQVWLTVAADYYHLNKVETFSGGTEATAFNPNAVNALRNCGFDIKVDDLSKSNPIYNIKWNGEMEPYQAFSKKYDAPPNPKDQFAAIMVCTEADKGCPLVQGAAFRLPLPYDDPKAFDGTPLEAVKYDERCGDISREMMYVMSLIK